MNIAYTIAQHRGDTDLLLFNVAKTLGALGYKTAGTVQINTERSADCRCDMDVQVLPAGQTIRISQSLGPGSKGCRLDPEALETAVALVDAQIENGADVLIINKFGKHEASGRGFRDAIAKALSYGIPVLVGTNALNEEAFVTFSANIAQRLPADEAGLVQWVQSHTGEAALVA